MLFDGKDYPDLEKLSLLGRRTELVLTRPVESYRRLDELYLFALEKQADALLATAQHEAAISKLSSLINGLPPSMRRNRARYLMARSYQELQKFVETKEQLQAIERDGVRDDTYKQALLDRGALQLAQSDLSGSIQTYSTFIQNLRPIHGAANVAATSTGSWRSRDTPKPGTRSAACSLAATWKMPRSIA